MKHRHRYHGFIHKYQNVYLYILILLGFGFFMGILFSNFIDVSDVKELSSFLTTIDAGVDKYTYFVSQFFIGIVFILFVFLLGTSLAGVPIISFVIFTKGLQIGFSCALFVMSYQLKGIAGIFMTLLPQILPDLIASFLICASALQLSMYIVYSCNNRERLDFKKLANSILNDLFICFLIVFIGSYLKSTLGIECIKLFNLI